MTYDDNYLIASAFFGTEPESILTGFFDQLGEKSLVLDVGAGQGRNSIFLATNLLSVHALEPSTVAANALRRIAAESDLDITMFQENFETFKQPRAYEGIMVFGLVPDLTWTSINTLLEKIDEWGMHGTMVWMTGFTTLDPGLQFYRKNWTEVSPNSFSGPDGKIRTYLETDQILSLFPEHTVLHHREGMGPLHRHGDGELEQHGMFEIVLQCPKSTKGQ